MDANTYNFLKQEVIISQVLFSVNNDIQIVFRTDKTTAEKLDDDEVLKCYLKAVIQEKVLTRYGIDDSTKINTIVRLDALDESKTIVSLGIAPTKVEQGVEELQFFVIDERLLETEEEPNTIDETASSSFSQNQSALEIVAGPTLRWNSEMTCSLIKIRGEMDREFNRAKYKFRLWETVAAKLNATLTTARVSAKDCDDKWRNIVATYRKNIDKIKNLGDNSVRWEYFNAMDEILKGTKELDSSNGASNGEKMTRLINELNQGLNHTRTTHSKPANDGVEVIDISAEGTSDEEMSAADDDESSQNRIITRKFTNEKRIWTTEMCLTLLYLRSQAEEKFQEDYDKVHLWRELAGEMNDRFLTDFNADEVESVWKYCVMTYDTSLDNLKSKGVNTIKWKYFAVMDELRGGTNEISEICIPRPGENLLKQFNKIKSNQMFECEMLPDNDVLCFTSGMSMIESLKDSDSEDASFATNSTLWTKDMVKTLIFLKKQINEDLSCNKVSRKRQWYTMARRFRALKNIRLSEEACEDKWRNLLRTYKKNLLRVKTRSATVKWPFFWQMREIVGTSVLLDHEKKLLSDTSTSRFSAASTSSAKNPSSVCDELDDDDDDMIVEQPNLRLDSLLNSVNDLRRTQTRMLNEIDSHKKVLQEVQKEQINIKSLLTQLLQKFA